MPWNIKPYRVKVTLTIKFQQIQRHSEIKYDKSEGIATRRKIRRKDSKSEKHFETIKTLTVVLSMPDPMENNS
jgi:hypothetical protein